MKMKILSLTVPDLMKDLAAKNILLESLNSGGTVITGIAPIEDCKPGDLVFVDKENYFPLIRDRRPSAVVTSPAYKTKVADLGDHAVLISSNVSLAQAYIKEKYASRDFGSSGWEGLHPSAVIHESAIIGFGTVIEPRVVIGKNARIGENCRIMAGTVIENDVTVGDKTVIHPLVLVGYGCRIGQNVVIGAGTVIGSSGFGYAQDKNGKSHHIPQTGIVVIEDNVGIGANNCIDRAAYQETRIGAGTKIDNLCHIAHNVTIGQDCLLTAMLCVAGSTKIGNRVMTSGQTGILDHIQVSDNVALVHRAGVTKDIENPGVYAGTPVLPLSEYMKNTAVMRSAVELRKRVGTLEEEISAIKSALGDSKTGTPDVAAPAPEI